MRLNHCTRNYGIVKKQREGERERERQRRTASRTPIYLSRVSRHIVLANKPSPFYGFTPFFTSTYSSSTTVPTNDQASRGCWRGSSLSADPMRERISIEHDPLRSFSFSFSRSTALKLDIFSSRYLASALLGLKSSETADKTMILQSIPAIPSPFHRENATRS